MSEDPVGELAIAMNVWLGTVETRFPRRARILRRMARSPFWCRCLLTAITRG